MTKGELCLDLSKKFSEIPMNKIDPSIGSYDPHFIQNKEECGACVGAYIAGFLGIERGYTDDFITGANKLATLFELELLQEGNHVTDFHNVNEYYHEDVYRSHADYRSQLSGLLHKCGAPKCPFSM